MLDKDRIKTKNAEDQAFQELPIQEKIKLASNAIKTFFLGKTLRSGESIPEEYLYSEESVDMVLYSEIIIAVDRVYASMANREYNDWVGAPPQERLYFGPETPEQIQDAQMNSKLLPSTEKVINILAKISERRIDQRFSAGIMLLYFKYCEGLDIK
jgi:hypothetical protein